MAFREVLTSPKTHMAASLAAIALGASANIHGHHILSAEQREAYDTYALCKDPVMYPGDRPVSCVEFMAKPKAYPSKSEINQQDAWEYAGAGITVVSMAFGVLSLRRYQNQSRHHKGTDEVPQWFDPLAPAEAQPLRETISNPYRLFREEPQLGRQIVHAYVLESDHQTDNVR
jgi:hypothetical protein